MLYMHCHDQAFVADRQLGLGKTKTPFILEIEQHVRNIWAADKKVLVGM